MIKDMMKVIYEKNGCSLKRIEEDEYTFQFSLHNRNIRVSKLLDFSLISLIYELNKDIFDFIDIERRGESEAIAVVLLKNVFEEIGLPQRYIHVHIRKQVDGDRTSFLLGSIRTHRPSMIPKEAEPMEVDNWRCDCEVGLESSKVVLHLHHLFIPSFAQKLVGLLFFKVFDRLKQFIENISRENKI